MKEVAIFELAFSRSCDLKKEISKTCLKLSRIQHILNNKNWKDEVIDSEIENQRNDIQNSFSQKLKRWYYEIDGESSSSNLKGNYLYK